MQSERIIIRNDVVELRRMTEWLRASAAAVDLPGDLTYKFDVVANEAVANIIGYAYEDSAGHDITLELMKIAGGACLVIRDDGKPFNLLEAPPHRNPASIEDAAVGGLGIHLIRHLMSRCTYRREDGFNVLSLEAGRALQPGNA